MLLPLQLGQREVLAHIQDDLLLSASLWSNVALAGLSVLLFSYMARDVRSRRARLVFAATVFIPLVSLSSYLGLVSGLTAGFLQMPTGHALAGDQVLVQWGRYLTWTLSTPLILLALGLLADADPVDLAAVIAADIAMCVTGLAAALTVSSYAFRWAFYGVSSAFFLVVLYALLTRWPDSAAAAGTDEIFDTLRTLTVVLWIGYPVVWALGVEGLAVVDSTALTSWGYSLLDIGAKYVFAYLLLDWVAGNEGVLVGGPLDAARGDVSATRD
ncbi:bacteriorhodopsin [Halolamina rubra]|uniref:bacteriorhodopsin n=1 Tax=Halolamina rubra TaxID=1380430 RepID=UPI001929AE52|nr:bacteriorhodopsin [Halolamina rubra]